MIGTFFFSKWWYFSIYFSYSLSLWLVHCMYTKCTESRGSNGRNRKKNIFFNTNVENLLNIWWFPSPSIHSGVFVWWIFWERVSESESIKQNGIRQWRGPRWMMYGKIDTLFSSIISLISIELTVYSRAPSRTGGWFLWAWAFEHRRRLFCLSRSLFRLFAARPPFCSMLCVRCVAPDQKSSSSRGTEKIQMLWVCVKLSFGARLCKSRNEIYFIWMEVVPMCRSRAKQWTVVCVSAGQIQPDIWEHCRRYNANEKKERREKCEAAVENCVLCSDISLMSSNIGQLGMKSEPELRS